MIVGVVTSDPVAWLAPEDQALARVVATTLSKLLKDRVVAHMSKSDIHALLSLVRDGEPSSSQRAVLNALPRLALARDNCAASPHVAVGSVSASISALEQVDCIYDLPGTSAAQKCLDPLPGGREGQSRETVFKKNLGDLAARAHRVIVYDRYAQKSLASKNGSKSGAAWLLQRLVRAGIPEVILTTAYSGAEPAHEVQARVRSLPDLGQIEIEFGPDSAAPHDRHIRFLFGLNRQSVAIGLAAGADIFARDKLKENYDLYWTRAGTARDRETSLKAAGERLRRK